MFLWDLLLVIGGLRLIYIVLRWFYYNYLCKINLEQYKYGWIIVTGASDGIGKGLSLELARLGLKVIMISRNKDKLEKVAKEIILLSSNPNIKTIVADFGFSHRNPEEFYKSLMNQLSSYEISGVVNNLGTCNLDEFVNQSLETLEESLGLNIYPLTLLSHYLIPKFVDRHRSTGKRSLMINLSSVVDVTVHPRLAVYSATKRYDDFFSEIIRAEHSHCIDVATVKPATVDTPLTQKYKFTGFPQTVSCNEYCQHLLKNLHKGYNTGHWKHTLVLFAKVIFPHQITTFILQKFTPFVFRYYNVA
jgi:17beta-estradiol 17-dehydrogenase / very-long-chain 3-oxoacyl-CoA reductase